VYSAPQYPVINKTEDMEDIYISYWFLLN